MSSPALYALYAFDARPRHTSSTACPQCAWAQQLWALLLRLYPFTSKLPPLFHRPPTPASLYPRVDANAELRGGSSALQPHAPHISAHVQPQTIKRAAAGQKKWQQRSAEERAELLRKWNAAILDNQGTPRCLALPRCLSCRAAPPTTPWERRPTPFPRPNSRRHRRGPHHPLSCFRASTKTTSLAS